MHNRSESPPIMAIACGGSCGHLFPGMAVANELVARGCEVTLFVSAKEIDQQAAVPASKIQVVTLPAVGLTRGKAVAFVRGFTQSYTAAKNLFQDRPPRSVLGMGGFTAGPPTLAARRCGAVCFLHESNVVPGRANRLLARVVDRSFLGFPSTTRYLSCRHITITGTPVRPEFRPREAAQCRTALALNPDRPVLLIMGGSQGAAAINHLLLQCLDPLTRQIPNLQILHLTGGHDFENVANTYARLKLQARVLPFCSQMELALGAATAAIGRAGASSLAELVAVGVPAILVPYPAATGNHQFHNAHAFATTGAAHLLEQSAATTATLTPLVLELILDHSRREQMQQALARWHAPRAAQEIALSMLGH